MFNSGVLDTVIGLVFVFLLVSVLVTIVNEMIASAMKSRAKWLKYGIARLLGNDWAKQFYAHPLIEGSSAMPPDDKKLATAFSGTVLRRMERGFGPSYIASRTFANVLLQLLRDGNSVLRNAQLSLQNVLDQASAATDSVAGVRTRISDLAATMDATHAVSAALATDLTRLLATIPADQAGFVAKWGKQVEDRAATMTDLALKQALTAIWTQTRATPPDIASIRTNLRAAIDQIPAGAANDMARSDLNILMYRLDAGYTVGDAAVDLQNFVQGLSARYVREMIEGLQNEKIKVTLLTLFDDAQNDVEKFKQNIEVWFNGAMDRVGGWYKRQSQKIIFAVSLVVAVAMNVDAMLIFKYLNTHSGVRDALVAQAKAYNDANNPALIDNVADAAKAATPPGTEPAAPAASPAPPKVVAGTIFTGTFQFAAAIPKDGTVVLASSAPDEVALQPTTVSGDGLVKSVQYSANTAIAAPPMKVTITATGEGAAKGVIAGTQTLEITPSLPAQFRAVQGLLMNQSLPIGWVDRDKATPEEVKMRLANPLQGNFWGTVGFHFFGWLLTALAASLGAPFWFDTLNRLMSIRSAGKAPEEMPKKPEVVQEPMGPGESPQQANARGALRS